MSDNHGSGRASHLCWARIGVKPTVLAASSRGGGLGRDLAAMVEPGGRRLRPSARLRCGGGGLIVPSGRAACPSCHSRRGNFALDGGKARGKGATAPCAGSTGRGGRGFGVLADGTARGGRGLAHRARRAARREGRTARQNRSLLRVAHSLPGVADRLAGGMKSVSGGRNRRVERGGPLLAVGRGPAVRGRGLAMRAR